LSELPELPDHLNCFFKPEFYPHPVEQIEMMQTHISWVFLTGRFAYKIKKPVNFGFLDFSSLQQRKQFCERELRLNRRLSPDIYIEVLAVSLHGNKCTLGGESHIVDYCLKMQQFRQSDLLDNRLADNHFNPAWVDQLAGKIARFHRREEAVNNSRIDAGLLLDEHIQDNLAVGEKHVGRALSYATMQQLSDYAEQACAELSELLNGRQTDGFVRRCHGDLHLQNITLFNYQPQLFDCIEFNDEYSMIDVMNDVAFLMMDLDAHQRPDLAMRLISRYLEHTGDYPGLKLLRYYLYYRACVRGKVACLLAAELEKEKQPPLYAQAKQYFALAASYTTAGEAKLFAVGGLSGSGKSHLALLGCGPERAVIIRSDATRKRIAADYPELELYGKAMHINTYNAMFEAGRIALNAGFSVILDATFTHPDSRRQLRLLSEACHAPLCFFWLDIDVETLKQRIAGRQKAADDISDADLRVLNLQLAEYKRPAETWIQFVSSSNRWPQDTMNCAL